MLWGLQVMSGLNSSHQCDMLENAPANIQLELLMALLFSLRPVVLKKSQVVKVVTQPPPKSQSSKAFFCIHEASIYILVGLFSDGSF